MAVEYVSAGSPDGTVVGRSSTDKIAFHNVTPVAKAVCTLSAAITSGATTTAVAAAYVELYAALAAKGIIG
jgi:hypothetical protein